MCRIRGNSAIKSHRIQVTAIWRSYVEVHESVGYMYSFLCLNWLRSCIATTLKLHSSHDLNSQLKYQSSNLRACLVQLVDWFVLWGRGWYQQLLSFPWPFSEFQSSLFRRSYQSREACSSRWLVQLQFAELSCSNSRSWHSAPSCYEHVFALKIKERCLWSWCVINRIYRSKERYFQGLFLAYTI